MLWILRGDDHPVSLGPCPRELGVENNSDLKEIIPLQPAHTHHHPHPPSSCVRPGYDSAPPWDQNIQVAQAQASSRCVAESQQRELSLETRDSPPWISRGCTKLQKIIPNKNYSYLKFILDLKQIFDYVSQNNTWKWFKKESYTTKRLVRNNRGPLIHLLESLIF